MTECSSGEVEVEGYEKEEVEQFIKFLYTLKLEEEVGNYRTVILINQRVYRVSRNIL